MPDPNTAAPLGPDGFPVTNWSPPSAAPKPAPPPAAPAAVDPPAAPPAPKPKARFVGEGHSRRVPLSMPVEFDGRVYDAITVKRLTVQDFSTYFAVPVEERGRLPAFVDEAGKLVPDEVMDGLAFEDSAAVMGAMEDFIPAALRVAAAPEQSQAPQTGEGSPLP